MSKEFFETMEKVEKSARDIKFLENMHPEVSNTFMGPAIEALMVMSKLEEDLKKDLKRIHSKPVNPRNGGKKNGRPKSKSQD